ncbi:MAG: septation ring formation regulator EzrA [Candidatus Enteromonas sp.]|nr:septation ring formation regulator EzrA [Candidatus Enteromonas sp.]
MKIFADTVNLPLIITLVSIGVVLVVVLLIVLNFTVFAHMRANRMVNELIRRFEYLHALLFGQCATHLKRIESISNYNIEYIAIFQSFSKRVKDIREKGDAVAQLEVNKLKDLIAERDYKTLKIEFGNASNAVARYGQDVDSLARDLQAVVRPEEDCRTASLQLKEKLRKVKQDYYVKQADLSLVSASFEKAFGLLEDHFKEFEDFVEKADYDEAKELLPRIGGVIDALGKILVDMPNLCITIQSMIPEKIASLQNRYEELLKAGYPLHHLISSASIQDMQTQLKDITLRVQDFNLPGVQQELDAILARIDDYMTAFEKEKDARVTFDSECDGIYKEEAVVEKRYIRLCNSLTDVKRIYALPSSEQEKIDEIKKLINVSGAAKRTLDTLIHSGSRQPFTLLVERMYALRDDAIRASNAIEDFNRFLLSMKADSEEASRSLYLYDTRLRDAEYRLSTMRVPAFCEPMEERINALYGVIDQIKAKLTMPIDVIAVNELVNRLKTEGDAVVREIDLGLQNQRLTDSTVKFCNRYRSMNPEYNARVAQGEGLYFAGQFAAAYATISELAKKDTQGEE